MATRDWALNEPVITALKSRLEGSLPETISALAASLPADDAAILATPAQILDYAPPPSHLTVFPTVGLLDRSSQLLDDTGNSVTGLHKVDAVIYLCDPDQRKLAWGLRRYAQAVLGVMLEGRYLPANPGEHRNAAWGTGPGLILWGETLQDEQEPRTYLSWVTVGIWARREEIAD